jgi:hypothetical protein
MTHHPPAPSRRGTALLAGCLAAAFALGGCAHPSKNASSSSGGLGEGQTSASTDPSAQAIGGPTATAGQPATAPTTKAPTRAPTNTTSTAFGPQIVSFTVVGKANCGGSGPGYSSPGTVTLSWKVTGANSVALSIDNPGIVGAYQSGYGLEATETLPFGCGGSAGSTITHKYTIVAVYPGANRSRTLDVSATYYG